MAKYTTGEEETGFPNDVLETLRRKIGQYASMALGEYIGKTSGDNGGEAAMQSRYDDYKRQNGIQEMILLYESSSENFADQVERNLVEFSMERHANISLNQRDGGGGRDPNPAKKYYVYAAYRWNQ